MRLGLKKLAMCGIALTLPLASMTEAAQKGGRGKGGGGGGGGNPGGVQIGGGGGGGGNIGGVQAGGGGNGGVQLGGGGGNNQPRVNAQPQINTQPRVNAQPQINAQPKVNAQPNLNAQPRVNTPPQTNTSPRVTTPSNNSANTGNNSTLPLNTKGGAQSNTTLKPNLGNINPGKGNNPNSNNQNLNNAIPGLNRGNSNNGANSNAQGNRNPLNNSLNNTLNNAINPNGNPLNQQGNNNGGNNRNPGNRNPGNNNPGLNNIPGTNNIPGLNGLGNNRNRNNNNNNNNDNNNNNRRGQNNSGAFGINTGNNGLNALINQSLGGNVYNRNNLNNPAFRAAINQNNYRNYNRYSNYGRYSWYRGPNYNPYGWYGGFAGIGYGLGSNYGYGGPGYGYGFGYGNGLGWGISSLLFRSGYGSYYNPYYSANYGGYNYAQPIYVQSTAIELPQAVISDFDQARQAFKNGQFSEAQASIDRAIQAEPNDPVLHEFRALVLFALGNYDQAAGTIHAVLAVGPGWDWATLVGLYSNVNVYTQQLRALEEYTRNNPQSASSRFYLAYLYQTSGQTDAAVKSLKEVVAINPKDEGAAAMLQMLESKPNAGTPNPASTASTEPALPNDPALNTSALVGTWHATKDDGRFDVTLNADQTFNWKFNQGQRNDEISGTYTSEGPVLILNTKDHGSMAGKVTVAQTDGNQPSAFQFQMVGANPNDPGLKFER